MRLILLAKNQQKQMIFTCEHGTIHLTHRQTTICMTHQIFESLAHQLGKNSLVVRLSSTLMQIQETEDGYIEFWFESGGWRFRFFDYVAFVDLIRQAAEKLQSVDKIKFTGEALQQPTRLRTPYSLN